MSTLQDVSEMAVINITDSATTGIRRDVTASGSAATVADVDILAELDNRRSRSPNYEREHKAMAELTAEMADNPRNMLQKLVEIAVDVCDAHTAGISLLDGDAFRWEAVAGAYAASRGVTMPRNESPCGVCIDRNAAQLMHLPDRCFPALPKEPRFIEILLVPFHRHGDPTGTVWIVSHNFERKFDREDERIVRILAQFASVGWQLWQASEADAADTRRKDDFLATLGHELRNPISAIAAASAVLQQRAHEPSVERAVGVIVRQTEHMSQLVGDLLDVARIGRGKLELKLQTVDLCTVVAETIETRRAQIERRGHVLTVDLGSGQAWVEADPVRLAQIVSNLVDNAAKYTHEKGHIFVKVTSGDNHVTVEVRDTGVGVPAERAESIFEPFTQLSGASSVGGLGLGLALVRSLTQLHGGTVNLVSAGPGQGSCFTVSLPTRQG